MGRKHHPRRGSLQFWPHKRSKKHCARVRTWATVKENKLLGFLGYKVGMTHLLVKDNNPNSHLKDRDIFTPVTVIECPPMKVYSIRYYLENEDNDQEIVSEVFSKKVDKELKRKITASKKDNKLYQSCHILHKQGRYFITHFKELFLLDGKPSNLTENDLKRRNTIVKLMDDWGLLTTVAPIGETASLNQIKIISHKDKNDWELCPKYNIGIK